MLGILLALEGLAAEPPPGGYDDESPRELQEQTEPRAPKEQPTPHSFLFWTGLGLGFTRPSEHDAILEKDGYALDSRAEISLGAAGVLGQRVAIGGYAGVGRGTDSPTSDAPVLAQTVARVGGTLQLVLCPSASVLLLIGPEAGVLEGTLSLHGDGESQTVLEYGGAFGAYARMGAGSPSSYLGATIAYTLAPANPPGAVGRDYDYGALHLELTLVLGG